MPSPRETLRALLDAALAAALPERVVAAHLPTANELPAGRVIVIGAGKASAAMAKAVEDHWPGDPARLGGLVKIGRAHV